MIKDNNPTNNNNESHDETNNPIFPPINKENRNPIYTNSNKENNRSSDKIQKRKNFIRLIWRRWGDLKLESRIQIILTATTILILIAYIIAFKDQHIQTRRALIRADTANFYTRQSLSETKKAIDISNKALQLAIHSDSLNEIFAIKDTLAKDRNTKRELRAYISIDNFTNIIVQPNKPIEFKIVIINTGKTPAYKIDCWLYATLGSEQINQNIIANLKKKLTTQGVGATSIGFNQMNDIFVHINEPFWNEMTYNKITSKESLFNILGQISYSDVFNERHITQFCIKYSPTGNNFHFNTKYNYAN
jgi:hypothetical protein